MKALILAGLLLSTAIGFADPPRFLLAVKDAKNSSKSGWNVKIGEVYQFVRTLSASEYKGGTPDPADQSYMEVQIDDVKVESPAANFVPVQDKDLMVATTKYAEEVKQLHNTDDTEKKSQGVTLSAKQRESMMAYLFHRGVFDHYSEMEVLSDDMLSSLYQKALNQAAGGRSVEIEMK